MIPPFIFSAASRLGVKGGIIFALILALAVQTARIEGVLWFDGLKAELALKQAQIDKISDAQETAELKAIAAKLQAERKYAEKAKEADNAHAKELAGALDRANAFIRANRVQCPQAGNSLSRSAAPAEGGSAEGADRPDHVAVLAQDVMICTENTERLKAAKAWADGLGD